MKPTYEHCTNNNHEDNSEKSESKAERKRDKRAATISNNKSAKIDQKINACTINFIILDCAERMRASNKVATLQSGVCMACKRYFHILKWIFLFDAVFSLSYILCASVVCPCAMDMKLNLEL